LERGRENRNIHSAGWRDRGIDTSIDPVEGRPRQALRDGLDSLSFHLFLNFCRIFEWLDHFEIVFPWRKSSRSGQVTGTFPRPPAFSYRHIPSNQLIPYLDLLFFLGGETPRPRERKKDPRRGIRGNGFFASPERKKGPCPATGIGPC
jgi:hypothetical protein